MRVIRRSHVAAKCASAESHDASLSHELVELGAEPITKLRHCCCLELWGAQEQDHETDSEGAAPPAEQQLTKRRLSDRDKQHASR